MYDDYGYSRGLSAGTVVGIVFAIVLLFVSLIVADEIGQGKGRPHGWVWGLLGPIGVAYLYMLPGHTPRAPRSPDSKARPDEASDLR